MPYKVVNNEGLELGRLGWHKKGKIYKTLAAAKAAITVNKKYLPGRAEGIEKAKILYGGIDFWTEVSI